MLRQRWSKAQGISWDLEMMGLAGVLMNEF